MTKIIFIAIGGGGGAVLRYLVSAWGQRITQGAFPLGTMMVNVSGCLAIGLIGALFGGPVLVREEYRAAILIGLLGGYTTYSSFGWETVMLANDGQFGRALMNVLVTTTLGLAAVWIGYRLGERWFGV